MERRRVVITGLGAVTPLGLTAPESWRAAREGACGIGPITRYDPAGMKVRLAAEVKGFDPDALFGKPEAKRMGREARKMLDEKFTPEVHYRSLIEILKNPTSE